MSRAQAETLPPSARAIALLLASTPTVQDTQPGVLHQLLEFSHRYTSQVLSDAQVYADHAGRSGKIDLDDVILAVQARVGWEFGGRIPKEYIMQLATQTNSQPLPSVPEVFGVRLPPASDCLTSVDFDLVPNKPPPEVKIFDEEIEEVEEDEDEEEDEDMAMDALPAEDGVGLLPSMSRRPAQTPSDADMLGTPAPAHEGSEAEEEEDDGLFAGGDEGSGDEAMEEVQTQDSGPIKRKLVEEDDYD